MKFTRLLFPLMPLLFASVASAQQSCAYTYSWTKPQSFAFCVTQYGTIGMIQSPVGTDHLNTSNPVEGFEWYINDNGGGTYSGAQVPGIGQQGFPGIATFSEPKGAGKLPLIASWSPGVGFTETFTADPKQRTITIAFKVMDCGPGCEWFGSLVRAAQPVLDGNTTANFGSSKYAALAYEDHGLMLQSSCTGVLSGTIPTDLYNDDCGGGPFTGVGAIYALPYFDTHKTHSAVLTFTYRIF